MFVLVLKVSMVWMNSQKGLLQLLASFLLTNLSLAFAMVQREPGSIKKSAIIEEKFEEEGYFDLTLRGDPALIKELKKRTQS